ncbi:MAG: hypothetical protein ACT4O4_02440 [Nitrospiraceae bacterium]
MKLLLASLLVLIPLTVHAEYLGDLSDNELNPNSIFNDIGAYSPLSPTSPRNPIGLYGSPLSPYSSTNPLAIEAPGLYGPEGVKGIKVGFEISAILSKSYRGGNSRSFLVIR